MMPFTILYNEYIDQPKFTEQKNPFDYIVGSEQKIVRNKLKIRRAYVFFYYLKSLSRLARDSWIISLKLDRKFICHFA